MLVDEKTLPKVPFGGMNEVHLREINILNDLYEALENNLPREEIEKRFVRFLEDVERHFSYEEGLMEKTRFFAYPVHKGEHDRVRAELKSLFEEWKKTGDNERVKRYLKEIFLPWLIEHVQTMDTATATYIVQVSGLIPFKE